MNLIEEYQNILIYYKKILNDSELLELKNLIDRLSIIRYEKPDKSLENMSSFKEYEFQSTSYLNQFRKNRYFNFNYKEYLKGSVLIGSIPSKILDDENHEKFYTGFIVNKHNKINMVLIPRKYFL